MEEKITDKEFFCWLGSAICLLTGIILLIVTVAPPINWGMVLGTMLTILAWLLAFESGEITGRREERKRREKEQERLNSEKPMLK